MRDKKRKPEKGVVYTSEYGKMCPGCGEPAANCRCGTALPTDIPDGRNVRVRLETKGRRGKVVTLIEGLPLAPSDLKDLSKKLKSKCGTGGTIRGGVIEIQGDHAARLIEELSSLGWSAKRG